MGLIVTVASMVPAGRHPVVSQYNQHLPRSESHRRVVYQLVCPSQNRRHHRMCRSKFVSTMVYSQRVSHHKICPGLVGFKMLVQMDSNGVVYRIQVIHIKAWITGAVGRI